MIYLLATVRPQISSRNADQIILTLDCTTSDSLLVLGLHLRESVAPCCRGNGGGVGSPSQIIQSLRAILLTFHRSVKGQRGEGGNRGLVQGWVFISLDAE